MDLLWWIEFSLIGYALLSIFTYLIPILNTKFAKPQDVKKKYSAEWALVTGGSSGIGKALVERLAKQKLNVVIVALDDDLLKNFHKEISETYPNQKFRAVGVNLGKRDDNYDYLELIKKNTDDVTVQILFNCAGYLILKGFVKADLNSQITNIECNAVSAFRITHHFMSKMVEKKVKGCITFVSSVVAYFPAPGNTAYASGKGFLANMATSLSIEGKPYGIDVTCIFPGPMNTRFYEGQPKLDILDFMKMISDTPQTVADVLLTCVGKVTWRDISLYAILSRFSVRIIDPNLMCPFLAWSQTYLPDYKKNPQLS